MDTIKKPDWNEIENILRNGDFSPDKSYNLGKLGNLEIIKNKFSGMIYGFMYNENGKRIYLFKGEDEKEFERDVLNTFGNNEVHYQNKAILYQEGKLRIKENGLEKTSQYYQTLQSKNKEGGN